MEGVRRRREEAWDMRRGRKACRVVKGESRCVVNVSDQEVGERKDIGDVKS